MSKRKGKARRPTTTVPHRARGVTIDPTATQILRRMLDQRRLTQDAFSNPIARLGFATPSISEGTEYPLTRLTNNYQLLNSLYRNHWVIRNVVDTIPEDMCRNWIRIRSELPPEDLDKIERIWRVRRLKQRILHGLKWGRLYGGAAGLMMIEGHEDQLDQPLDFDLIMPGSFKNLLIIDRWTGCYPSEELEDDLNDVEFGLPKYYEITMDDGRLLKVHHSRVIRFVGRQLPYYEQLAELHWGASEIEIVFEELKKRDNTSWNILQLTFLANLRVLKMEGLDQLLAIGDSQLQQDIYNTLQSQNWMLSNSGMQLIGPQDEFQTFQYTFAGLNDIYQSFMMDLAGATKIPVTKLFGRSPAGMNATGESDLQNYYETVMQAQEANLAPVLDKLLPVICMSELGYVPDDLVYDFNPVHEPDDNDLAELVQQKTTALTNLYNAGILSQKQVLKELQQLSETTGMFTNITDEDVANADDRVTLGEAMPDGGELAAPETDRAGIPEHAATGAAAASPFARWFQRSLRHH